jgi:PfaB family protein
VLTNGKTFHHKIAIVGMETCFGRWQGLNALAQAVFEGKQIFETDPASASQVSPAIEFEVDLQGLGISPDEFEHLAPAQLLALETAGQALKNAGFSLEDELPRLGILAAGQPPAEDLPALIAGHWDISGPLLSDSGVNGWIGKGITQVESWFSLGEAQTALLIGMNVLPDQAGDPNVTQGAAAVVLKPLEAAQECGDRIYAVIEGWAGSDAEISLAFQDAGRSPSEVGFVEACAGGDCGAAELEAAAKIAAYPASADAASIALGSIATNLGDTGPIAGLAGLIHASLAVYHRLIPGASGWQAPEDPAAWQNSPYYVPTSSRPWFVRPGQGERVAGVNTARPDSSYCHLILSRAEDNGERANPFLRNAAVRLFPIGGASPAELLARLDHLQSTLETSGDLIATARRAFQEYSGENSGPLALALIAGSPADLLREIEFARKGMPKAFERGAEWQTPLGSYFTPAPVGDQGGVAFVYPGAFNSFIGLGKDLFQLFPAIYPRFSRVTQDMGGVLRERSLYPRGTAAYNQKELDDLEAGLSRDPVAMLTSGTSLAVLYTHVLRHVFDIHPMSAFGYSLGETSMLFALEVWSDGDAGNAGLSGSPVFQCRLSGPKETVREVWGMPPANGTVSEDPLWSNLLLMATPEAVLAQMQGEPRVYLTHINTPRQVVIAGEPAAVRRVAERLGCPALQAPFDHVLHCDPVRLEFDRLAGLHDFPVQPNTETALYTAAGYTPVHFDQTEISRDIAETLCSCLDFPRLVNRVYADGARIFVEVGAGSNCSRWVDEILKGSPHLAVPVSRKGSDDLSALLRTLARLVSHRAAVNLSPLYSEPMHDHTPASLRRTVRIGKAG